MQYREKVGWKFMKPYFCFQVLKISVKYACFTLYIFMSAIDTPVMTGKVIMTNKKLKNEQLG